MCKFTTFCKFDFEIILLKNGVNPPQYYIVDMLWVPLLTCYLTSFCCRRKAVLIRRIYYTTMLKQSYFLIQIKIKFSNDGRDLRQILQACMECNEYIYVEIVASLIIVISFVWNTNILSHPKKNIWSNICVLSITEISLFWLVYPTLNVTMSCCVTPYILVKSGKKLPNIRQNLLPQSYWQNTICTEQGRSLFLRNKFLQDHVVYSPDSSP